MISRATLPVYAALALTGIGGGIYLGKAAISEINPAYFNDSEPRFHSELVPQRPGDEAGYQAGQLSAANYEQAFGKGCIGCREYPEEMVLVHRGAAAKVEVEYSEIAPAPVQALAYEQAPSVEFASIERYTAYPVQAPVPAAQPEPPAPEAVAAEPVELAAAEQTTE
ncbi:MAG TPA: hypothetical protein VF628_03285 [Allosphingosinicella sp.]|jgi:hypothetical protein